MPLFFSRHKKEIVAKEVASLNRGLEEQKFTGSLQKNVALLREVFRDVDLLVVRHFTSGDGVKFCIAFCEGVVNAKIINENVVKPVMLSQDLNTGKKLEQTLLEKVIQINEIRTTDQMREIVENITYGDTVLFADGMDGAVILNTKGFSTRSVAEPENEKVLSGPREGFTESLVQNLSLLRRKVRTNELKMKYLTFGKVTRTKACICYIDRLINKDILKELYRRLDTIDIDAVLDTNYLTELIKDNKYSPFRTTGYTERPDVVVGKILEGRIAIFLDGTPVVLTVPYLFIENFQNSEDYYMNFYYTSFSRVLRIIGFLLTIGVPGFYIAIVGYHHEMLPTPLLISIATERKGVPLPAALEAYIMLAMFDLLRETGIRMPVNIGQALSIVGALVIGQAAVDAKLVAAPMIIVVGVTGITSLLVPKMNAPIIYTRVFLLSAATAFGLFGFFLASSATMVHVLSLYSFGIPQISFNGDPQFQQVKDTFIRAPWETMITRRKSLTRDRVRMNSGKGGESK